MASNKCDNSYSPHSGFSVEERILKLIDESKIELAPYEVARKVHTFYESLFLRLLSPDYLMLSLVFVDGQENME